MILACSVLASPFVPQLPPAYAPPLPPLASSASSAAAFASSSRGWLSFGGAAEAAPSELKGRLDEYGRQYSAARRQELKDAQKEEGSGGAKRESSREASRLPTERELWAAELDRDRAIIKVLYAYLEEIERDIFARKWTTLLEYVNVFSRQEAAFVALIENAFPGPSDANKQTTALMRYEAQQMFLQLDDMAEAARFKEVKKAEKAYVGLAIAYDRFLKAGDFYEVYDDTDTRKIYESVSAVRPSGSGPSVVGACCCRQVISGGAPYIPKRRP